MMIIFIFSLLFILNPFQSFAEPPPKNTPPKTSFQVYENEEEGYSFSAKVRTIREVYEDVEVFFDTKNHKGAFTLPKSNNKALMLKRLEKSREPKGGPVQIRADKNRNIVSVDSE